ncbi:uncharacterized protein J4E87_004108 [Alternaria ethzedia]|uniref:uncharacterized protein n=1 Tax=Alternaria ethzedia TaxID=181014 RepID=UPI0020C527CD|nr:uncharacterized protein J4E87_004108 [Alternaria ethzedia]XP_049249201.1 uncharacterized protein J4E84_001049 [Alternaria hordeiaustralica]XP_051353676.1 uncharacterized protein J4E92_004446 [Alternaria infectoria]KAI4627544.1 hypothetical protein J4E87_004108 [Alternaria ethzedia]KAI4697915.1 hypothetical protein J4E84_001049 [Alternaria hordeiaustralica]KAI4930614.1 hypothetical protein J4E92_004446 [Alternaria infectoria]
MAVKLDHAHVARRPEEAEVSTCVSGIIEAFQNGLDIFKSLRERRRKRRSKRDTDTPDSTSTAEHQLSKSLRRGPEEVAGKYTECYYSGIGPRFAKGDAIAHQSLAETLIKLNTGLVAIIAAFLNHDAQKSGKGHLDIDYKSLTHLSDASRREAIQSLTQLYQRLSQSQLQLHNIGAPPCPRCGTSKHHDCSSRSTSPEKDKKKSSSTRQRSSGHVVTRMSMKNRSSNEPRLVVMRPKTTRKGSSSSKESSSVKSPSSSSRSSSPLASPQPKKIQMAPQLPLYVPVDPFELETSGVIRGTLGGAAPRASSGGVKKRVDSFDDPREPWPQENAYTTTKSPSPKHHNEPTPKLPTFTPTSRRSPSPAHSKPAVSSKPPPVPEKPSYLSPPPLLDQAPATLHFRRRLDKATPSSYTFASGSTRLGEIPERRWNMPFDYQEAERLNTEAALNGYPNAPTADAKDAKKKKRFGFMRRGD